MAVFHDVFSPDAVWRHLGHSQVSREYDGLDAILAFFGRSFELSEGTILVEVEDIAANDGRVFVMTHHTARAGNRVLDDHQVHIYEIADDRAQRVTQYLGDQAAVDAFWG